MFKFGDKNTRISCEICSKLTITTLERRCCSGFFIVLALVFLLLNLSRQMPAGNENRKNAK